MSSDCVSHLETYQGISKSPLRLGEDPRELKDGHELP
jgi:hypothetical protein